MKDYFIVGDTKRYGTCLIYTCGKSREVAEKVLDRMLNNPNEQDKKELKAHTNIRINEEESENCWWNDPFLAN